MSQITRRHFGAAALGAASTLALPWAAVAGDWRTGFQTAPDSLDSELTLLEGRVPADLRGTFFRVGPAQFERDGERLGHWFDGDGMVQRFAFADGRVRHRGRFVLTGKRQAEHAAGRFLRAGYGFAPKAGGGVRSIDDLNAANTNVLPVGNEIWALWEGGSPWRVDRESLETVGRKVFPGALDGAPFSAHPRRGSDGDVWNFGVIGGRCVIWQLAPDASVRQAKLLELPAPSLMHDFAVTSRHVVLLLPPFLAGDNEGAKSLLDSYRWHPDRPLQVLVLDKDTLAVTRRYDLPPRFLFHIGNAWEDTTGTIRIDAFLDDDATFAVKSARDLASGLSTVDPTARLAVISLHADGRAAIAELPGTGEFPRVNPRHVGLRHRFTYGIIANGVARWDLETGAHQTFRYGQDTWSEEPVLTPRPDARGEDDGWLVATVLNYAAERTELAVFDARRIADGPVARLACPYPLPLGFHGAFIEA